MAEFGANALAVYKLSFDRNTYTKVMCRCVDENITARGSKEPDSAFPLEAGGRCSRFGVHELGGHGSCRTQHLPQQESVRILT